MPPAEATKARGKGEGKDVGCGAWPMLEECVVRAKGLPEIELASEANTEGADDAIVGLPIATVGGLILFSFCLLKYN